jgi:PKD repeat protein/glucose/arabinose dehydrogenase
VPSRQRLCAAPRPSYLVAVAALALLPLATPRDAQAVSVPAQFVVENAVPGITFTQPTQVTFLPDGRWLVAEKGGTVWVVQNGVRLATPFWQRTNEVLDNGDRGLLSVCVDRNFTTNRYVYFLYTVDPDSNGTDDNDDAFSRLTRYQASTSNPNVIDMTTRTVLIGTDWRHGIISASPSHTIGTVRQSVDGTLLITAGDGAQFTNPADGGGQDPGEFGPTKADPNEDIGAFRAQYIGSLNGKVLRIDPTTGLGVPSNPFYQSATPGSNQSRVWCYGLRNPFRFNFRPNTGSTDPAVGSPGTLYIGEVGWSSWEEQNITTVGQRNFGWPCYEGFGTVSEYTSQSPAHDGCSTLANRPVLTAPIIAYPHIASQGTSTPPGIIGNTAIGGTFYTSNIYPQAYRGQYFFGDYGSNWIRVATVDGNNALVSVASFGTSMDGPVDFELDPVTGDVLYVAILTGEVRRIRWTGAIDNNRAPSVIANGSPTSGIAPLTVVFSAAGSDPDNDPLSFSWNFGDNTTSTQQNPTHQYSAGGAFNAIVTISDGRGGVGKDTVQVTVTPNGVGFPSTAVLDNFNRANQALGSPWVDPVYNNASLSINNNALVQTCCVYGAPVYGAQSFGPDQEAFISIPQLGLGAPEHDLMLKLQSASYNAAHVEVRYDDARKGVYVATYEPGVGWIDRGTPIGATFGSGDQLGARAYANGSIEVYRNGILIGTRSVTGWAYAAAGGYIGLTLDGASASRLDDFGGGNISLNSNAKPHAFIDTPANGAFYWAGENIALAGHATDDKDAASALQYHWQVDLHHNTHIHPAVFTDSGSTSTYVGVDHDDGTGVFVEIQFQVKDTGGLVDTARVYIYPEIDLSPSNLAFTPPSPTTADTLKVSFDITNTGRLPAPITRWRLRANNTMLAEGDTLVPALATVHVTTKAPPILAAGTYALRVAVDTLNKAVELNETNNAQTIPLVIGPGPNRPPVAVAGGTPKTGGAPLVVAFSSAGSSDPDLDLLGYAWAFGDGSSSTAANPSKTYSNPGSYTAVLTVTDGRGGADTASVPIVVTNGPPTFPATAVLDNFDRANGPVGAPWAGDVNGFIVAGNAATQNCCYVSAVWNGAVFGPDQEVYLTFTQIATNAREQDLMLKVQGTSYTTGHIEVRYDSPPGRIQVSTYQSGKWTNRGTSITTTFAAGDRFGARALANGNVEVYKNATLLGTRSVTAWPFYNLGGRVGLTIENAQNARYDNYGGGSVAFAGATLAAAPDSLAGAMFAKASAPMTAAVPGSLELSVPYPSPTDGLSRMDLSLPRAANVELTVFDVQGRRVWGESRAYDAGRWTLSWTGRDDAGQRAPRGIYLARVNVSGGPTLVRRIALMP